MPSVAIPSIAIPSIEIPSIEIPSIDVPSIEVPSLGAGADPELAARFPTTVEGATVGEVETGRYLEAVEAFVGPEAAQQFRTAVGSAGMDANAITYGSQFITVDENVVIQLEALRTPGADASGFVAIWPQLTQILQPEESPPALSPTTVAGKNVTALTEADGDVDYLYVSGDVVWRIRGGDDAQATAILNALD